MSNSSNFCGICFFHNKITLHINCVFAVSDEPWRHFNVQVVRIVCFPRSNFGSIKVWIMMIRLRLHKYVLCPGDTTKHRPRILSPRSTDLTRSGICTRSRCASPTRFPVRLGSRSGTRSTSHRYHHFIARPSKLNMVEHRWGRLAPKGGGGLTQKQTL